MRIASCVAWPYDVAMSTSLEPRQLRRPQFVVNDRLAKARYEAEISVERMAQLMGCSTRTITRCQRAGTKVPRAVLLGYYVACEVDLDWLEFGEAGVHPPGLEPGTHWFTAGICAYCGEREDPDYLAPVTRLPQTRTVLATPPTSPIPSGGVPRPERGAAA